MTPSATNHFSWQKSIRLFLTGVTMGAADLVPGVSGGTVAFILGIYEELIYSIKLISGEVLKLFLQLKFKEAWSLIPFSFLVPLGLGLVGAVLTLSKVISFLLEDHPSLLWAFFFGLVVASVWVVKKRVVTWDFHDYAAAIVTAIATYFLVGVVPVETPNNPVALFLSGAIAICAMILPGISGSFLLVIMGKYEQVLNAVTTFDLYTIFIFGSGAVVGIAFFSRLLSYLFNKHHDIVIAILTGFMVGSLRKVWPWKEVLETRLNSHGEVVPLIERNILPLTVTPEVISCILLALVGYLFIMLLEKFEVTKEQLEDIPDPTFSKQHKKSLMSQKHHKI